MSQTTKTKQVIPTLTIRQRHTNDPTGITRISTGFNTEVLLDGKHYPITFLKLEMKPKNLVKVQIEMLVKVDVQLENVETEITKKTY